ncbi:hypothetical protein [Aureivirga marina]|uniref:hypothetical protein n=1 Tax=Aureivirga marina TaxID=1182451 RepID=UPI0018C98ACE|nr:hypothetical protein [Aureivirga marina]
MIINYLNKSDLLTVIVLACFRLQSNFVYIGEKTHENDISKSEDSRNTYIADGISSTQKFIAKDQTRMGTSHGGKNSGEIDIYIYDRFDKPLSIIEALNLTSLNKNYIKLHIDKLFVYDTVGLNENYILIYYSGKQFETFSVKYYTYINNFDFKYKKSKLEKIEKFNFADILIYKTFHNRNQKEVYLYHILVNMNNQ